MRSVSQRVARQALQRPGMGKQIRRGKNAASSESISASSILFQTHFFSLSFSLSGSPLRWLVAGFAGDGDFSRSVLTLRRCWTPRQCNVWPTQNVVLRRGAKKKRRAKNNKNQTIWTRKKNIVKNKKREKSADAQPRSIYDCMFSIAPAAPNIRAPRRGIAHKFKCASVPVCVGMSVCAGRTGGAAPGRK